MARSGGDPAPPADEVGGTCGQAGCGWRRGTGHWGRPVVTGSRALSLRPGCRVLRSSLHCTSAMMFCLTCVESHGVGRHGLSSGTMGPNTRSLL